MRREAACARSMVVIAMVVTASGLAHAAPDPEGADALFEDAKVALTRGDWGAACSLLEESMAKDPSPSTELKIARCRERSGRLLETVRLVEHARGLNGSKNAPRPALREELESLAVRWLTELAQRIPRIRVAYASPTPGTRVWLDGAPLELDGEGRAVDPGRHEVSVESPGYEPLTLSLTVTESERRTLAPHLVPVRGPSAPQPPSERSSGAATGAPRPLVIALATIGAGLLGGSAYLAARTRADVIDSNTYCTESDACTQTGVQLRERARREQGWAIGLGLSALVLGSTAAAVHVVARASRDPSVDVALRW